MAASLMNLDSAESAALFTQACVEERWYAAYTCANQEKRVAKQLEERAVENFLPLYSSVRRWTDRRVELQLPLFPGYVFVHLALRDRLQVLMIPSVVRLVGFGGMPTALPEDQIEILRSGLSKQSHTAPHPFLTTGRRVRITGGAFTGLEGILIRRKNRLRLVLSVDMIMRSISVDIAEADVVPILRSDARSLNNDVP